VRDYTELETAWRQDPVLGLEHTARRLNISPDQLYNAWQQRHSSDPNWRATSSSYTSSAEANRVIEDAMAGPHMPHLHSAQCVDWMTSQLGARAQDGRTVGQHLVERIPDMRQRLAHVYREYEKAFDRQTILDRNAQQRADMADAEKRWSAGKATI
jgi:hypothetical protein